jgi:hypothetical protein
MPVVVVSATSLLVVAMVAVVITNVSTARIGFRLVPVVEVGRRDSVGAIITNRLPVEMGVPGIPVVLPVDVGMMPVETPVVAVDSDSAGAITPTRLPVEMGVPMPVGLVGDIMPEEMPVFDLDSAEAALNKQQVPVEIPVDAVVAFMPAQPVEGPQQLVHLQRGHPVL